METIQEIVNSKMEEMATNGTLQKTIETNIEKAITKAIEDQFSHFGNISEQIKTVINKGLKIDTSDLPFETYNAQMLVLIKNKLGNMFQGAAAEKFIGEMDKILAPPPEEMTINELVETIVGFWKTDEPWDSDMDDNASVEVNESYGGFGLKIWKERARSPTLELYILYDRIRISHKHKYNLTCFSETEAFVFRLYAAGTKITEMENFNEGDCDLTLKGMED